MRRWTRKLIGIWQKITAKILWRRGRKINWLCKKGSIILRQCRPRKHFYSKEARTVFTKSVYFPSSSPKNFCCNFLPNADQFQGPSSHNLFRSKYQKVYLGFLLAKYRAPRRIQGLPSLSHRSEIPCLQCPNT